MAFWIPALMGLGQLFGAMAGSRQQARTTQGTQQLNQDQLRTSQYQTQQQAILQALNALERAGMDRAQLDLLRRQFALQAPATRMQQAAQGSVLANAQDVRVPDHPRAYVPHIQGGARPSNLTPEARQLGSVVARNALLQQLKGDTFAPVPTPNFAGGVLAQPGVQALPRASGLDMFLNLAALGLGGAGAIGHAMQPTTGTQQAQTNIATLLQNTNPNLWQNPNLFAPPGGLVGG